MLHFTTRPWHLLWHRGRLSLLAVLVLSLTVSGCSSIPFFGNDDDDDEEVDIEVIDTTEERVYSQAQRALRSSNFSVAIEQLELLEARFPFGRFAEQAQLELIYAHYLTQDTSLLALECTSNDFDDASDFDSRGHCLWFEVR